MGFYTCALQQCVMCVWIFLFMNTYWLFSLPHHVFRSIYLCVCVCVFIHLFCIVYEYCTSMRVQKCRGGGPAESGYPCWAWLGRHSEIDVILITREVAYHKGPGPVRPFVLCTRRCYTHTHTRTLFPIDRLSLSLFLFHSFCFKMY